MGTHYFLKKVNFLKRDFTSFSFSFAESKRSHRTNYEIILGAIQIIHRINNRCTESVCDRCGAGGHTGDACPKNMMTCQYCDQEYVFLTFNFEFFQQYDKGQGDFERFSIFILQNVTIKKI